MYICKMILTERIIYNEEWIYVLGILILLLWVCAKFIDKERFYCFLSFFSNEKYTQERIRENNWFGIIELLFVFSGLCCLSYLILEFAYYQSYIPKKDSFSYIKILLIVSAFLIVKNLILKIVFFFFEIEQYFKWYWFYKIIGFIWFSNLLFFLYVWQLSVYSATPIFIVVGVVLFIGGYVWFFKKLNDKYHQLIINQFLYFILYLCALEIAPYVFAYKLMEAIKL